MRRERRLASNGWKSVDVDKETEKEGSEAKATKETD